jgi:hypothetical protein
LAAERTGYTTSFFLDAGARAVYPAGHPRHSAIIEKIQEVLIMSKVEEIQSAIVSLSPEEYARLRQWFAERDWEQWDQEIEEDAASGKLDFLIDDAVAEKAQGRLQDL